MLVSITTLQLHITQQQWVVRKSQERQNPETIYLWAEFSQPAQYVISLYKRIKAYTSAFVCLCLFSYSHSRHQNYIWPNVTNQQHDSRHWHCNLGLLLDVFKQRSSSSYQTQASVNEISVSKAFEATYRVACCGANIEVFEELRGAPILTSYLLPDLCCNSPVNRGERERDI